MFSLLCPAANTKFRPTVATGVITNAGNGYDVDASPWSTYASRALVTGSSVSGTPDTVSVVWNGFASVPKSGFTTCNLQIVLNWTGGSSTSATGTPPAGFFPFVGTTIAYRVNGGTYINLAQYSSTVYSTAPVAGSGAENYSGYKVVLATAIPASSFTANLNNLDVQTSVTTFTWNNGAYSFVTFASYDIWDIQVNLV